MRGKRRCRDARLRNADGNHGGDEAGTQGRKVLPGWRLRWSICHEGALGSVRWDQVYPDRRRQWSEHRRVHRRHDFRRRRAAGRHGNAVLHTPADDLFVKARRDDKFGTAFDSLFALLERDDRACAN